MDTHSATRCYHLDLRKIDLHEASKLGQVSFFHSLVTTLKEQMRQYRQLAKTFLHDWVLNISFVSFAHW